MEEQTTKYKSRVDEWVTWSTTPHTEDEIREKVLTDYDNVCFSYVCEYSHMSADFIEELMALSLDMITKDNYYEYIDDLKKAVQIYLGVEEGNIEDLHLPPIKEKYMSQQKLKEKCMGTAKITDEPAINEKSTKKKRASRIKDDGIDNYDDEDNEKLSPADAPVNRFNDKIDWSFIRMRKDLPNWFRLKYRDVMYKTRTTNGRPDCHNSGKKSDKEIIKKELKGIRGDWCK